MLYVYHALVVFSHVVFVRILVARSFIISIIVSFTAGVFVRSICFVGSFRVPYTLTYTCFLWCTSDLEEEHIQLGDHQEPEES